jgi:predicted RecB family nuclease
VQFRASDVYDYYYPSRCALRVALRHRGEPEDETASPFDELLRTLGKAHERAHLAFLAGAVDLTGFSPEERERRTMLEMRAGAPALYQPRLRLGIEVCGEDCELVGEPDFLIRDGSGYRIRDSKLKRNIGADRPGAIPLQLQLYGFLYERATGQAPRALEVHAGAGDIVPIPYDGGDAAFAFLRYLHRMREAPADAYEPVGWSKCDRCGYSARCWGRATGSSDISILHEVSQDRARALHASGITTVPELLRAFEDPARRELFGEKGKNGGKPFGWVAKIRRDAEAHSTGRPVVIAEPRLPDRGDCVSFDLEGAQAYADEIEKVYLWGLKTSGPGSSRCLSVVASFGPEGDREAWREFLGIAARLLEERPGLRFVHWGSYERTKVRQYAELHGDPDGTAARVLERLLDLFEIVRKSFALPLPSYGLKRVGEYVGFRRRLPEGRGDWAIAKYIEATETRDPAARAAILAEILAYNEEDLNATSAVLEWARGQTASADSETGCASTAGRGAGS